MKKSWPELPALEDWQDTLTTVHMWSQIVGKIKLAYAPPINQWWGIALYVTTNGLTTGAMPLDGRTFSIDFNFREHRIEMRDSEGAESGFSLEPMTVADFYARMRGVLRDMNIKAEILARPVEVEEAIPFPEDEVHKSYDREPVERFWQALVQVDQVFNEFRSRFTGKVSPSHFFWGAFDLAVTRFSGRTAPKHPGGVPNCADWVMEEAYSHEVSSAGFWAGPGLGEAAFYSYAYPEPEGFREASVGPDEAYFAEELGEFVLPYSAVQRSEDPSAALIEFLQSTYEAAANLGNWDREALEK
ncbi:MAG: hypothetical protein DWQ47_01210 [Acidobacteria bacterium]|nr:MAG: hypothetical protein DWQ32_11670 [Acidobacteriota bacterium]REK04120.1 MAG: hypothetical protein DWQ38_01195 [Acidobacteriota bacterium]REK15282.1 MAG: hypothetical protein DWQ43_17360 [Acidobacteriota bacterium]REK46372.1 MAG: hypothetical protein DWQ47_01210 [Acidobacteriota bacterium]